MNQKDKEKVFELSDKIIDFTGLYGDAVTINDVEIVMCSLMIAYLHIAMHLLEDDLRNRYFELTVKELKNRIKGVKKSEKNK